jgi:uncharacterized Zn finger protein
MVGTVTVAPGVLRAAVQGSRPTPYRSAVRVPVLPDTGWDGLLDTIAARAGHTAALLDGEMPAELVHDAEQAGVPFLPGPAELDPECSCPDWGHPCKHAAALAYAIGFTVDADPFTLFTLRGRTKDQVLAALRERRSARAAPDGDSASTTVTGVPAASAYIAELPPLPATWPRPTPRTAATLVEPPPVTGLTAAVLTQAATDSATRATRLLQGDTSLLHLSHREDIARRAATAPDVETFHTLQRTTRIRPHELARLARAWRYGGRAGVAALDTEPPAPAEVLSTARALLTTALADMTPHTARLRTRSSRITVEGHDVQLRYGPDRQWHPYRRHEDALWWPAAPAEPDPVGALSSAWEHG